MRQFEDELTLALRRPEPPSGFADRLRARRAGQLSLSSRTGSGRHRSRPLQSWRWLAAAAVLLLTVAGSSVHYWRQRREGLRRDADTARLVWALDLTGRKVRGLEETVRGKRWAGLFAVQQSGSSSIESRKKED
jgi:hypothetical protein